MLSTKIEYPLAWYPYHPHHLSLTGYRCGDLYDDYWCPTSPRGLMTIQAEDALAAPYPCGLLMRFKWWRHLAFMSANANSGKELPAVSTDLWPDRILSRLLSGQSCARCSVISSNRAHFSPAQNGGDFLSMPLDVVAANWYLNTPVLITYTYVCCVCSAVLFSVRFY